MDTKQCFKNNSFISPAHYSTDKELETKHPQQWVASIPFALAGPSLVDNNLHWSLGLQVSWVAAHEGKPKCHLRTPKECKHQVLGEMGAHKARVVLQPDNLLSIIPHA